MKIASSLKSLKKRMKILEPETYFSPSPGAIISGKFSPLNNLAAKLLIALLPPNQAFFRLSIDDMKLQQEMENYKDLQSELDQQLSLMERAVMRDIEESGDRTALFLQFSKASISRSQKSTGIFSINFKTAIPSIPEPHPKSRQLSK